MLLTFIFNSELNSSTLISIHQQMIITLKLPHITLIVKVASLSPLRQSANKNRMSCASTITIELSITSFVCSCFFDDLGISWLVLSLVVNNKQNKEGWSDNQWSSFSVQPKLMISSNYTKDQQIRTKYRQCPWNSHCPQARTLADSVIHKLQFNFQTSQGWLFFRVGR